ncbi:phenazine biosynthesis protein PhzC [Streptomyces amakusaensis]|uniref:Phospho-2-dehydro-3-deoxyheptonate aldolase n=1 Tax=Streptomyces amakusaensis TaxID=67271 RepID=A0ABW0AL60_9ACTN
MKTPYPDTASRAPAPQQPHWPDQAAAHRVRERLARLPRLVQPEEIRLLHGRLTAVAAGEAHVVQAGDCAEDIAESTAGAVTAKVGLLDLLAGAMTLRTRRPTVRVGRMAGQYAKPRSSPVEWVNGVELPVFRGQLVNTPAPDPRGRRPDPRRMLVGHRAARRTLAHLGWGRPDAWPYDPAPPWTSHEALLLDYETPQVRHADGVRWLTSTHWPWIGARTRDPDGAHVALLASVANPVAVKVGPDLGPDEALALCRRLDPHRTPGRLTFVSRMGAGRVLSRLPPLVRAVRAAGYPVVWLCDPMHGNTVRAPSGAKTRCVETVVRELAEFREAVALAGGTAGGTHLEATPDDIAECVWADGELPGTGSAYRTLCDPRLNPAQAMAVVDSW